MPKFGHTLYKSRGENCSRHSTPLQIWIHPKDVREIAPIQPTYIGALKFEHTPYNGLCNSLAVEYIIVHRLNRQHELFHETGEKSFYIVVPKFGGKEYLSLYATAHAKERKTQSETPQIQEGSRALLLFNFL